MNCLVVDDDILSLKAVEICISKTPFLTHIASCLNATAAIKIIRENKIDLIFLDVEMPGTNGFEMLEQLKSIPQIILVTGKAEYAAEAFNYDVTDFLVKPFDFERFIIAADRAKNYHELAKDIKTTEGSKNEFFIKKDSKFLKLNFTSIIFIEALADYVILYVTKEDSQDKSTERHTILSTMKAIESKLPGADFFRIHRSYIVRLDKIKSIDNNYVFILDKSLPVSRANKENLIKKLNL